MGIIEELAFVPIDLPRLMVGALIIYANVWIVLVAILIDYLRSLRSVAREG